MALLDMTVAKVAAMISAGVTVVQFTYALALVIILIYLMRNDNSPSTWSVFVRILHYSSWPAILSTDVSNTSHTEKPVKRIDMLSNLIMILVTIAGVITPLGLIPAASQVPVDLSLHFLPDVQPLSLAITNRSLYVEERQCLNSFFGAAACPGRTLTNVTGQPAPQTDLTIPQNITDTFTSTNHTSPFNLQYRRYVMSTNDVNSTSLHPVPDVTISNSVLLSNKLFAVDGLIIDTTESPGVGIGNLQVPYLPHGATWNQEMLWIEPETACVDLGFTLNFKLSDTATVSIYGSDNNVSLTDQGGFSNFNYTFSDYGRNGQQITMEDRAKKLAFFTNIFIKAEYNISNRASYVGKNWSINGLSRLTPMQIGSFDPSMISGLLPLNSTYAKNNSGVLNNAMSCQGFGGMDDVNITNTAVQCYIFVGAPIRTDGGDSNLVEANSSWLQPFYACASTVRVKLQTLTVSFNSTTNTTTTLPNLNLERHDTNKSVLWAVEHPGMYINQMDPYWGPVADQYENSTSLNTLRSDIFYLPAGNSMTWSSSATTDASALPAYALGLSLSNSISAVSSAYDYSGSQNGAMLKLWRNLSASADTVSRIRNLIWTDIMANNLYSNISVQSTTVMKNVPTVGYNLLYAIPAFVSLALWIFLMGITVVFIALDRISISSIRQALYQTSLGRVVVNITNNSRNHALKPEKWAAQENTNIIGLNISTNACHDHIQFHPVPQATSLWQVLNKSKKTIRKRKHEPQVSDPMELYPLDQDSDKNYLTKH
ncbi:hypothetical protein INT43_000335 [Umbelopsis isabellina]|uniref:Uncharacterized protein n=1 Tax=Mortierella isabellina TaxID=91625 RepID=A0A8H7Q4B3_MORIS|nr:hypothetical protein INT43_000335 [Umbelopsis isabellina]